MLNQTKEENKKIRTVILVTGTPGVGKTTIAHRLADKLNARYIGITELVKVENLVCGVDKKRKTLIVDTQRVSRKLQEILVASEGSIIIEGHYVVDVIPKDQVNAVFVLRRDPQELKNVLEKREYSENKVWENLAAEILDVCLWDALSTCGVNKLCEVDVSGKTVETVVEEMVLVLEKKKDCSFGSVDWLGKLEKIGQLEDFLKRI